jgi:hypothetical protein
MLATAGTVAGATVSVTFCTTPLHVAVIVAWAGALICDVVMVKVCVVAPFGTVMEEGTWTAAVLLLERVTDWPFFTAAVLIETVPVRLLPAVTLEELMLSRFVYVPEGDVTDNDFVMVVAE